MVPGGTERQLYMGRPVYPLNAILFRLGCNPFSRTIIALEAVSPLSEEEIIALQENNETWVGRSR